MPVTVMVEFQMKPEAAEQFRADLPQALEATRARDGNQSIEVLHNQDDPCNIVVFQRWDSRAQYESYLQWRLDTGMMEMMEPIVAKEPSIRFWDTGPGPADPA